MKNNQENPRPIYDYLGERMKTSVFEAGIDPDEISDKIDYSKQASILRKREQAIAKKAMEMAEASSEKLKILGYMNRGSFYIIEKEGLSIEADVHGPKLGESYLHFHLRDKYAKRQCICASVYRESEDEDYDVYLEPHNDFKTGEKDINKIINTEKEILIRDFVKFINEQEYSPETKRRPPKFSKAVKLDSDAPSVYGFDRNR